MERDHYNKYMYILNLIDDAQDNSQIRKYVILQNSGEIPLRDAVNNYNE